MIIIFLSASLVDLALTVWKIYSLNGIATFKQFIDVQRYCDPLYQITVWYSNLMVSCGTLYVFA